MDTRDHERCVQQQADVIAQFQPHVVVCVLVLVCSVHPRLSCTKIIPLSSFFFPLCVSNLFSQFLHLSPSPFCCLFLRYCLFSSLLKLYLLISPSHLLNPAFFFFLFPPSCIFLVLSMLSFLIPILFQIGSSFGGTVAVDLLKRKLWKGPTILLAQAWFSKTQDISFL